MQNNDNIETLEILSAKPAVLKEKAAFCNLTAMGEKGIYWARKSTRSPVTGKEHSLKFSTKTGDLKTALIRALPKIREWLVRIQNPELTNMYSGKLTLGELEQAYLTAPTVLAGKKTRNANFAELYRVIRLVHGAKVAVPTTPVKVINKQLAKDYQRLRLAFAEAEHKAKPDLLQLEATKRAINFALSHAQAVFSEQAREDFETLGLPPDVLAFADASKIRADKAPKVKNLADATVQAMMNNAVEQKGLDLGLWQAFQLMLWAGLRNGEVMAVRAGWFTKLDSGDYRLQLTDTVDYKFKGNDTSRVMPGAVVEELLATVVVPEGTPFAEAYVVSGTSKTDRHQAIYRRLGRWLKTQGVITQCDKVAYQLRKYFFAKVRQQQGLRLAAIAHGGDMATVDKFYAPEAEMAKPVILAPAAS